MYTGLIRIHAAYDIHNRTAYNLALYSFIGVIWFCATETVIYKTGRLRELGIAVIGSGTGVVWMLAQKSAYLSTS